MDGARFAALARSVPTGSSRRRAVGAVLGGSLSALGLRDITAKKKKGKGKGKDKKSCPTCPTPESCPSSPTPPPLELTYQCSGPTEAAFSTAGSVLIAQRFVATRSGALRQIQIPITKDPGTGDFVVQLVAVNGSPNGTPSDNPVNVLAAVTIPDASVPAGESTLIATFAGPQMVQGTEYAAAVSRRGAAYTPHARAGCDGTMYSGAPYSPSPLPVDLIVSVLVS